VKLYLLCFIFLGLSASDKNKDNISGSWVNPAYEDVTFWHDSKDGSLKVRWDFNSIATGPIILRGIGTAIKDVEKDIIKISVPINKFHLLIEGKVCESKDIHFSSDGMWYQNSLLMDNCQIAFVYQCAKEEPKTIYNYCSGRWE
jgi:hypothetical protein